MPRGAKKLPTGMLPWKAGQSGNPSGKPKWVSEIRDLARPHTAAAIQALVDIVSDDKATHAARVSAASELLNRAYGKAPQQIDANLSILDRLSPDEQATLEAALAVVGGDPEDIPAGVEETTH